MVALVEAARGVGERGRPVRGRTASLDRAHGGPQRHAQAARWPGEAQAVGESRPLTGRAPGRCAQDLERRARAGAHPQPLASTPSTSQAPPPPCIPARTRNSFTRSLAGRTRSQA
jgi:hypothetical protein